MHLKSNILTITLLLGTKGHSKDNSNPLELDEDDLERVSPCYKDSISCFKIYWQSKLIRPRMCMIPMPLH